MEDEDAVSKGETGGGGVTNFEVGDAACGWCLRLVTECKAAPCVLREAVAVFLKGKPAGTMKVTGVSPSGGTITVRETKE